MAKILVTGATGTIGKSLVKSLLDKKADFVAGVRNESKAREVLPPGTSFVTFDFDDRSTFEKAIEGVDRVFLLGPPIDMQLDKLLAPFIDFLKSKNINRVVYLSAMGEEHMDKLPFHGVLTRKLQQDGFDYTILKPSFFAQNFRNYEGQNILERGVVFVPAGDGKVAFIDVQDIGDSAAAVLLSEGHSGKTYVLTGPELLTYSDVAELLSEVTGKKIVYPKPNHEVYTQVLKDNGAPDFIAPYMISVYSLIDKGIAAKQTDTVEQLTGHKPGSLKQVLKKDFANVGANAR